MTTRQDELAVEPPFTSPSTRHKAFISYSHGSDLEFAPSLQRAIERFGRPWKRLPPLKVFRDRTNLSANPELWSGICAAMDGSECFILLLSEKSADSVWIGREITRWLATKQANRMILVITDGEWKWDDEAHDFDRAHSSAVHEALFGKLPEHPYVLDMRWVRTESTQLTLDNGRFHDQVLEIAAALHGKSKNEIEGEVVRHLRRTRRLRTALTSVLAILLVVAVVAGVVAAVQAAIAQQQRDEATVRELIAQAELIRVADPQQALRLVLAGHSISPGSEPDAGFVRILTENNYATTVRGHTSSVFSVAFSPDNRVLASGDGDDHTVRLWDVTDLANPKPLGQPITDNPGWVLSLAFAPDGHTLATASDNGVILWNVDDPAQPRELSTIATPGTGSGRADSLGVAFSPDSQVIVSTFGGRVGIWDVSSPSRPRKISREGFGEHAGRLSDTAFSPDGQMMALGMARKPEGNVVWLYRAGDPKSLRFASELSVGDEPLSALTFAPGKSILATAGSDVRLWDVSDPDKPKPIGNPITAHTGEVRDVAFSPDGSRMTTVSADQTAITWDISVPGTPSRVGDPRTDHTNQVYSVAYRRDGAMVTGSADNTVMLWQSAEGGRRLSVCSNSR